MANALSGISQSNKTDTLRNINGRLLGSFNPQTEKESGDSDYDITLIGNQLNVGIGSNVVYAAIHNYGGEIKAKNKPYLVFNIDGNWIRTTSVMIPARHYFDDAVKDLESSIDDEFLDYFVDKFRIAAMRFTYQGENGLLTQFQKELIKVKEDLRDKLPVLFQGFIGANMSDISVNEDWRNA